MISVLWHSKILQVARLVFRAGNLPEQEPLKDWARSSGLNVADEHCRPEPGDLWLGCRPPILSGHHRNMASMIGWTSLTEIPVAFLYLMASKNGFPVGTEQPDDWDVDLEECLLFEACL